jgi:hypothetical protein
VNRLAIVVRNDADDLILTPVSFAYTHARAAALQVDPGHAAEADWPRRPRHPGPQPPRVAPEATARRMTRPHP